MGEGRTPRVYSKTQTRLMFERIERTKAENQRSHFAASLHRQTDGLERAKIRLQRLGYVVFSHALHEPGSELIVVGRQRMTPDAVIAYAERYCPRTPQEDGQ